MPLGEGTWGPGEPGEFQGSPKSPYNVGGSVSGEAKPGVPLLFLRKPSPYKFQGK